MKSWLSCCASWMVATGILIGGLQADDGSFLDGPAANLIYDITTGNVIIDASDTPTGVFISFVLANEDGLLRPVAEGRFPFITSRFDNSPELISQTDLTLTGVVTADLGPIFPPGMTLIELTQFLSNAKFAYDLGKGGPLDLIVIPEPTGAVLFGLGLLLVRGSIRKRIDTKKENAPMISRFGS